MKTLIRKNIQTIVAYKAGKPIEETKRQLGLTRVIKLASNENPFGASPRAIKAMAKILPSLNRYPDSNCFALKNKLARALKLSPSNIVIGNGSDEIIDIIIKTFVENNEVILTSKVTFLEYEIVARVNGRKVITVPLKDYKYDLESIIKKVTGKTKLIFIANPNNPTATYINQKEWDSFITRLPRNILVVLDEAYDTFIDVDDYPAGLAYINCGNVIVTKTFSKAYGLAGIRLGYAIAPRKLAAAMEKARQPFNINTLAQAAGIAALDDKAFLKKTRGEILDGKKYLYAQLNKIRVSYIPSVANFILIDVKHNGVDIFKQLLRKGVIVRDMQQYGLKTFIRVTVGTASENKKFIAALKQVLAK